MNKVVKKVVEHKRVSLTFGNGYSSSGMIVYGGVYLAYQQGEGRDLGEERLFNNKYP